MARLDAQRGETPAENAGYLRTARLPCLLVFPRLANQISTGCTIAYSDSAAPAHVSADAAVVAVPYDRHRPAAVRPARSVASRRPVVRLGDALEDLTVLRSGVSTLQLISSERKKVIGTS
jgi:hypothetical protein